jgi:hypothetical protein
MSVVTDAQVDAALAGGRQYLLSDHRDGPAREVVRGMIEAALDVSTDADRVTLWRTLGDYPSDWSTSEAQPFARIETAEFVRVDGGAS